MAMVVILLLALHVALVLGNETMPLQDQQVRASGGYDCSYPWTSVPGLSSDCFYFVNDRKSWDSARSHCRSWSGGDLAILDTETKRRYLVNYMDSRGLRNGRSRHLGANDRYGYWRWLNGRSISSGWRRWKDGRADYEPDDDSGDDTCMYLYTDPFPAGRYDLLSDQKCSVGRYFLCEKRATDINECRSNNGGCQHTCTNTVGSFRCSCRNGYTINNDWKSCSDINECRSNNGGCQHTCTNTVGSFRCSCRNGYTINNDWKSCSDINECRTNNGGCKHNCINTLGSFKCSCRNGYSISSDKKSCNDINECKTNNGGCKHNCINTLGSFKCSCRNGYKISSDKNTCNDINECKTNNGGCKHNCINTLGSFKCSCRNGYSLSSDKKTCNDIDECWKNNGGCNQTCTNTDGSFTCSCKEGYLLGEDKKSCHDIDACWNNNGGCNQTCTNTDGSYTCSCKEGYFLGEDKKSCHDIDECWKNNGGCNQTCTNTDGSFTCSCKEGYFLGYDKKSCHDIDECWKNNGGCNQTCTNTDGSFTCSCKEGYFLGDDKKSCHDIDECWTNNGGCDQICTNTEGSFTCSCTEGYSLADDKKSCIGCTSPWVSVEGMEGCYLFVEDRKDWDDARSYCQENGGDLIILDTESKRRDMIIYMESQGMRNGRSRHLGANDRGGFWSWWNGRPVSNGWRREKNGRPDNEPDDDIGDDTCMYLYTDPYPSGRYDLLSDYKCTTERYFICQKFIHSTTSMTIGTTPIILTTAVTPTFKPHGCTSPWVSVKGMKDCYLFVQDRKDWDDARSYCQENGGDLIILDTESKRRDMIIYMENQGMRNGRSRHLGANDRYGYWRWLNGRSISSGWRRWKDGRADYEPDDDSGDDTCMYLYTDPFPAGRYDLLSDQKCSVGRYFICQKIIHSTTSMTKATSHTTLPTTVNPTTKPPECYETMRCKKAKGSCKVASECSGRKIKNGCKGGKGCVCCAPADDKCTTNKKFLKKCTKREGVCQSSPNCAAGNIVVAKGCKGKCTCCAPYKW